MKLHDPQSFTDRRTTVQEPSSTLSVDSVDAVVHASLLDFESFLVEHVEQVERANFLYIFLFRT